MERRKKTRVIHIHGRRWFERTNGNTYHSVDVWVNGEHVHRTDFAYGYGSHYEQTAQAALVKLGIVKDAEGRRLWSYCQDNNIEFVDAVTDVTCKRDL